MTKPNILRRTLSNSMHWLGHKTGFYSTIGDIAQIQMESSSGDAFELAFSNSAGSRSNIAGVRVDNVTALKLSVYYACVRNISEDIGKMPLKLYRSLPDDNGKEGATDETLYSLLKKQPNPNNTAMIFWQTLTQWAVNNGNGYAEIVRGAGGDVTALWPIHPSRVNTKFNTKEQMNEYEIKSDDNKIMTIPGKDMLHIRGYGDQFTGIGVITYAAQSIGLGLAQQEFQTNFYQNGTHIDGILSHPSVIGVEAGNRLRESFAKKYSGTKNAFKPVLLEEGLSWNAISMNLNDAQALESRKFQAEDIARWFRMPLHKIEILDHATFTNIESQNQEYVDDTLLPWLIRIEQEVMSKLIDDDSDLFVKFDTRILLRGNSQDRAKFYKDMFGMGALNQNEIRSFEDMNSIGDEGNVYYVPLNMQPVGEDADLVAVARRQPSSSTEASTDNQRFKLIEGFKRPLLHEAQRMVTKECHALDAAAKKENKQDSIDHMNKFYKYHINHMSEAFLPSYQSLIDLLGREVDASYILQRVCKGVCEKSEQMAETHIEKHTIETLSSQWKDKKAKGLVSQLIGLTEKDILDFQAENDSPEAGDYGEFAGVVYQYSNCGQWEELNEAG